MHVHQLMHLAFRNDIGGLRQHLHHTHVLGLHHHLKRAGVQEIAHEHTGRVTKGLVGRGAATTQGGLIDHVIMEQSGGVDELHHGR